MLTSGLKVLYVHTQIFGLHRAERVWGLLGLCRIMCRPCGVQTLVLLCAYGSSYCSWPAPTKISSGGRCLQSGLATPGVCQPWRAVAGPRGPLDPGAAESAATTAKPSCSVATARRRSASANPRPVSSPRCSCAEGAVGRMVFRLLECARQGAHRARRYYKCWKTNQKALRWSNWCAPGLRARGGGGNAFSPKPHVQYTSRCGAGARGRARCCSGWQTVRCLSWLRTCSWVMGGLVWQQPVWRASRATWRTSSGQAGRAEVCSRPGARGIVRDARARLSLMLRGPAGACEKKENLVYTSLVIIETQLRKEMQCSRSNLLGCPGAEIAFPSSSGPLHRFVEPARVVTFGTDISKIINKFAKLTWAFPILLAATAWPAARTTSPVILTAASRLKVRTVQPAVPPRAVLASGGSLVHCPVAHREGCCRQGRAALLATLRADRCGVLQLSMADKGHGRGRWESSCVLQLQCCGAA